MSFSKHSRAHTFHGILFVALFALSSLYIAESSGLAKIGITPLVIAIVLGIIYSNTLRHKLPAEWAPGIHFATKQILRLAIILYGFRVSIQDIASIGVAGVTVDLLIVSSTLILGYIIGVKLFKLDRHLTILISSGSAICGAAAVLAVEDILKSESHKAVVAVGTVVLFGTLAMFLYPFLQNIGLLGFTDDQFGLYAGAGIHEVAQVLVAGSNVSPHASNVAIVVKMTRVLLLIPVLILISVFENRYVQQKDIIIPRIKVPWFAIGFAVAIGFNSLHLLPISAVTFINTLDLFLLTMAMSAIGIETNLSKIKKVGLKPLYLAVILFLWLMGSLFFLINFWNG